jgi:WD40 repeat protein
MIFSSDNKRIVSGSEDTTVRVWVAASGENIRTPLRGHKVAVRAVACSADGHYILSGSDDGVVHAWDAFSGAILRKIFGNTAVVSVALSPDGTQIAAASFDKYLRLWFLDEDYTTICARHQDNIKAIKFSPDGAYISSISDDKNTRTWEIPQSAHAWDTIGINSCMSIEVHPYGDASHRYNIQDPIIITDERWIMESPVASSSPTTLLQIPPALLIDKVVASASGKMLIAFATSTELFITHFPKQSQRDLFIHPNLLLPINLQATMVSAHGEEDHTTLVESDGEDDDTSDEGYTTAEETDDL